MSQELDRSPGARLPQEMAGVDRLLMIVTPNFNLMATTAFLDPLRAANYLDGQAHFRWSFVSAEGGMVMASNGLGVATEPLAEVENRDYEFVVVSSSWSPEDHASRNLLVALRRWARKGVTLGALDTGAFILAEAGLLKGQSATVHYEHIDALQELYDDISVSENIFILGRERFTCCGGTAAVDMGLHLVRARHGNAAANAAARYIFHGSVRPEGSPQNPSNNEPLGLTLPHALRQVIVEMEKNLEEPVPIPELCERVGLSQRQLTRLFERYVGRTAVLYYRDIRLDRARSLVTQTDMPLFQVAAASGFASQAHFSAAYRERFGIAPRQDRHEGKVPFEFRAWPMHPKKL